MEQVGCPEMSKMLCNNQEERGPYQPKILLFQSVLNYYF